MKKAPDGDGANLFNNVEKYQSTIKKLIKKHIWKENTHELLICK